MLIINADDMGRNPIASDAIIECYEHNKITSTSFMVFMEDSERSAELVLSKGLEVGLHLNFSEKYTGNNVPRSLEMEQKRISFFLKKNKYSTVLYNPLLVSSFRLVFDYQLQEFTRLFGRLPTHYDGHQHYHLAMNILVNKLIPKGSNVRRNFSFLKGERNIFNRFYRYSVDSFLARNYVVTDYFYSLPSDLIIESFKKIIDNSHNAVVELMVHPERERENRFLLGENFLDVLSKVELASHVQM